MTEPSAPILRIPMSVVGLLPVVVGWELVGQWELTIAIPPLSEIAQAVWNVREIAGLWSAVTDSLVSLLIGFVLALLVGLPLGIALGVSDTLDAGIGFYINLVMSAPASAFVPLMIAIFGTEGNATVVVVFFFAVFVIVINTATGVRATPRPLVEMAQAFRVSRTKVIKSVLLPSAAPLALTGIRLGFGRAMAGLVLGEILIAIVGLGSLIIDAGTKFQMVRLWALVFLILAFTLAVIGLLEMLERRVAGWAYTSEERR